MLATARVWLENPEAVVVVLPADHLIGDEAMFLRRLGAGVEAASRETALVTFGIPPAFPATGYGYIRHNRGAGERIAGTVFYPVLGFKEKPDAVRAAEYIAAGDHAWNSGMFLWRAGVFAEKLERYAPELAPAWSGDRRRAEVGERRQAPDGIPAGPGHVHRLRPHGKGGRSPRRRRRFRLVGRGGLVGARRDLAP